MHKFPPWRKEVRERGSCHLENICYSGENRVLRRNKWDLGYEWWLEWGDNTDEVVLHGRRKKASCFCSRVVDQTNESWRFGTRRFLLQLDHSKWHSISFQHVNETKFLETAKQDRKWIDSKINNEMLMGFQGREKDRERERKRENYNIQKYAYNEKIENQ